MNKEIKYVLIKGGCAMRVTGNTIYRDAGDWEVGFDKTTMKIVSPEHPHLDGISLTECSEEEWREDNKGYV